MSEPEPEPLFAPLVRERVVPGAVRTRDDGPLVGSLGAVVELVPGLAGVVRRGKGTRRGAASIVGLDEISVLVVALPGGWRVVVREEGPLLELLPEVRGAPIPDPELSGRV